MKDNILKIQELLKKYNIKMWLLINKDNNDPIFYKYISKHLYTQSFLFILQNRCVLIISKLDKDNKDVSELVKNGVKVYVYDTEYEMLDLIEEVICNLQYIDKISLSYSTLGDKDTDILLHSDIKKYSSLLRRIYKKYHKKVRITSSEKVVYSLLSENSSKRLERIKLVAKITDEILDMTMKTISPNMTEKQIANEVIYNMLQVAKKYVNEDLINISVAWDCCPFVLVGKNFELNGHTPPSDTIFQKGDTVNIDFGIKAIFSDGKKVYSDMQRMGYALKNDEKEAPYRVQHVFNTLKNAIEDMLDYMKPDIKGYVIDEKLRSRIIKEGYTSYPHASGHPVGTRVHAIGTIIGSKLEPRSKIGLVDSGVYTLEPRIEIANGGSIEEMIEVTKFGGIPICNFQKELYLIK